MQATLDHPGLRGLGRIALVTTDAHQVYADCGFVPLPDPQRWMAITTPAAERYRAAPFRNAVTAETN